MADNVVNPSVSSNPNPSSGKDEASIKETVEAILIAFILAFIFRGFVVEAFVIPTGSMAPTLMGANMRFVCDDCGYTYEVNFSLPGSGDDLNVPTQAPGGVLAICPNCGYQLRNSEPGDQAYRPLIRYGDRILVLKYLYLFQQPHRWDVVVFKSPDRPKEYDYTQNYIKRLIGRPGEAIMILDGDIYAGPADANREDLKIQTKPREVQNALWRIVHDNDYEPRGLPRSGIGPYQQPWLRRGGTSGWNLGDAPSSTRKREFTFDNLNGGGEIFFNDQANIRHERRSSALNDWLAYDVDAQRPEGDWSLVGDLKLQLFYQRRAGDGPLKLGLSKRGQYFVAEIGTKTARLLTSNGASAPHELIGAKELPSGSGPMKIEFTNVDYQVTLRVDDQIVLQTTSDQYHPNVRALLASERPVDVPHISIYAEKQQATISHLSLWRDVYYLSAGHKQDNQRTPFLGSKENIVRLKSDEYFTMGDNSQISGDGRYWTDPTILPYENLNVDAGKVPARFLLGKAFFVYWPAGYRPFENTSLPAMVPNFGDMRMIH